MKILNFSEFSLNESDDINQEDFYKVPGVKNFIEDGYEISAENCIDSEDYPSFKISAIEENPTAIRICYCDEHGNVVEDMWIPKDSVDINNDSEDNIIITIHPDCRWINNPGNRENLEDFIENFDGIRTDDGEKDDRRIESIKDDLENFLEAIGFELTVTDINKIGENEYEIYLDNNICANVKKRNTADIIGKVSLYKDKIIGDPGIELSGNQDGILMISKIPDLFTKEVECQLDDFEENPYLRYLLRKPLDLDSNSDREKLLSYYVDTHDNHDKGKYESGDEKIRNSSREESYHIKDLRKMLSQFLSEERLRRISSDY
jgi:hypothetical protein